MKPKWSNHLFYNPLVTSSILMNLTKLLRSNRTMNCMKMDTIKGQVGKTEALCVVLRKSQVLGSTFFWIKTASEAGCPWTLNLGPISFTAYAGFFWKEPFLALRRKAIGAKGPEQSRLPWKHFHSPNSDFLRKVSEITYKHQHFSHALTWKGQGSFLKRASSWSPSLGLQDIGWHKWSREIKIKGASP